MADLVRDGLVTVTYNSTVLTYDDVINIDEFREDSGSQPTSGPIVASGIANASNADEITIDFTNASSSDYCISVAIEDNINWWVEKISNTQFKVYFLATYTGGVHWAAIKI